MNIAQFKKWLKSKIQFLENLPHAERAADDYFQAKESVEEAYNLSIELRIPEATEILGKPGPVIVRLLEALNSIPESPEKQVYSLAEAAEYLGYSASGLRKIVKKKNQNEIRFAQNGQGPIKFQREWLDEFVRDRKSVDRSPAQKRSQPITTPTGHGFDTDLLR